jgi:hypothetical protein
MSMQLSIFETVLKYNKAENWGFIPVYYQNIAIDVVKIESVLARVETMRTRCGLMNNDTKATFIKELYTS